MIHFPLLNNCYTRVSHFLPSLAKWHPSEDTLKRAAIMSVVTSTILWSSSKAPVENESVSLINKMVVASLILYTIEQKNSRWYALAITINNCVNVFVKSIDPVLCLLPVAALAPFYVIMQWTEAQDKTKLQEIQDIRQKVRSLQKNTHPGPIQHIRPVNGDLPTTTFPKLSMTNMQKILDESVVGQERAKQAIIEAIFFHQTNIHNNSGFKLPKGNILLIGPSGSGKTYIIETICRHLDIPMASMDISRATTEGIVGPKISDAFVSLLQAAEGDREKASKGIVFFDEIDKVFEDSVGNKINEVRGLAIQNQLLRLLQGDKFFVGGRNGGANSGQTTLFNTENVLFIFAGAFHHQVTQSQGRSLNDEDLITGGVRPEFLGRIGYVSQLLSLTRDEIKQILTHGPNAVLTAWKKQFEHFGFQLILKEETLEEIVSNAMIKQTGARGLHYEVCARLSNLLARHVMEKEKLGEPTEFSKLQVIEV